MKNIYCRVLLVMVLAVLVTAGASLGGIAAAMQFSEPVKIGEFWTKDGKNFRSSAGALNKPYYDFGVDGKDVVRVYAKTRLFGSTTDMNNTVKYWGGGIVSIYHIKSDSGITFYVIQNGGTDGVQEFDIVGKTKDGKFIKYIGHEELRSYHSESEFFGPMGNVCSIQVEGDTLILNGGIKKYQGIQKQWQFRLKWDDAAQWFGIDYQDL